MYFSLSRFTIGDAHTSDSLEFAPTAFAKLAAEPQDISNASTNRDDLDILDLANDLEMHTAV